MVTLQSYHDTLLRLQSATEDLDEMMLVIPGNELVANIDQRITMEGLDTKGAKIGDYSREKIWVGVNDFTNTGNFKPERKANGEMRKTMTLEEGYYELRKLDGQRNDRVVLERTGAGIKNIKVGIPQSHVVDVGFTDENESNKFRGYEDRNEKQILDPSEQELANYRTAQIREYRILISKIFAT